MTSGDDCIRIAMWSGPRNISTAMMRSFENRSDSAVSDEPFYSAYLYETGLDHPMRGEVIASQPNDWRNVVRRITGAPPEGKAVWYQKHMTHHMLPHYGLHWLSSFRNCFLIRDPAAVIASYAAKREGFSAQELGYERQVEIFNRECDRLGHVPPVLDAKDVLSDPKGALSALCAAIGIAFQDEMLAWPAGRRKTDGIWADHWYASVEASTGFAPYAEKEIVIPPGMQSAYEDCMIPYQTMSKHRLVG